MNRKRRALVLADESAHHPFLRSLPPHVRGRSAAITLDRFRPSFDWREWKAFATTFAVTFLLVSVYIA